MKLKNIIFPVLEDFLPIKTPVSPHLSSVLPQLYYSGSLCSPFLMALVCISYGCAK